MKFRLNRISLYNHSFGSVVSLILFSQLMHCAGTGADKVGAADERNQNHGNRAQAPSLGGGAGSSQSRFSAANANAYEHNTIEQTRVACDTTLGIAKEVSIDVEGTKRTILTNEIPEHVVGGFPNESNPNTISSQEASYLVDVNPSFASETTYLGKNGPNYLFGITAKGIPLDPVAAEPWTDGETGESNWEWNLEAANNDLGLDCNLAHVQPTGAYHYHGVSEESDMVASLEPDDRGLYFVGWAADGFPIYYKYGLAEGVASELASSYQLKSGEREGDGISAPGKQYTGIFVGDYEYVEGLGDLDECNGFMDSNGDYIYILTDTFPWIPRCFKGHPDESFALGGGNGGGGAGMLPQNRGPQGGPGQPPQEALDACDGRGEGLSCSFKGMQGEELNGVCFTPGGSAPLACKPI